MKKMHTILVFAQNKRGVLERISMLIRKKMYNLEQITASDTEIKGIKRLTISFSHEEGAKLPQIISQMKNIVEVIEVKLVDPEMSIQREVALIKIERPKNLPELISLANIFEAKVVNTSGKNLILEVTGSPTKIDDFLNMLSPYKILKYGSSGSVAIEK